MPDVRVNDATFADLQSIAKWLGIETPPRTIDRLVREKMDQLGLKPSDTPGDPQGEIITDDPDLSHTRILDASVGGERLEKPKRWKSLLVKMIAAARKGSGMDPQALSRELQILSKPYEYNSEGYTYQPELGISIQGQRAQDAWKETERLADKYRIAVEVRFQWQEKDKAQHPGRIGSLRAGS
ncbi:MAG: hypothetical protein GDA49_03970 [Rhodospirillales bacterium]|nr:hypothetical protein [Rhodospirillales bacterium]